MLCGAVLQERANSSPGLQAFLEKKGDEHAFSCLYLIAGIVCLYAAFSHGNEFCTTMEAAALVKTAPVLASTAPHRALLGAPFTATSKARMAAMKGNMLDEEPAETAAAPAEESAAALKAPAASALAEGGNSTHGSSDGDSDDDDGMPKMTKTTFLGPQGWVVTWLTVEGVTALGLPLVSIVMLLMRLHENACVSCILYLVAVFQALWLIGKFVYSQTLTHIIPTSHFRIIIHTYTPHPSSPHILRTCLAHL